ncbi:putative membrane protein, partial [Streptomyces venezuelae ATCC 10712]
MGWTVLYIAFGVVALWLLGEVLLQYKARLRWRVLAFCGFLGVVLGVLLPSVAVIIAGAVAFAVGQTYVTLSFRRGFSTGWAIGGSPGASRRRRSGAPAQAGPTLEVTELSYDAEDAPYDAPEGAAEPSAAESTAVYEPLPMPDDTGQYGVYGSGHEAGQDTGHGAAHTTTGYEA